jgi:2TM domain
MLTKEAAKNGQSLRSPAASQDDALRKLALRQLERVRSFKVHLAVFLVGMPILTAVWALTEYMNADGWPDRFSDSAGPGTWNPWILWVLLIWGGLLAIQGVRAYFGRPPTGAEIDRELERLRAR